MRALPPRPPRIQGGRKKAKFTTADSGRVFQPGDPGYHGPREKAQSASRHATAAQSANLDERLKQSDSELRRLSRQGGGVLVAGAAAGGATGALIPATVAVQERSDLNRRIKRTQAQRRKIAKARWNPRRAWHASDPGIRHAQRSKRGVYNVTGVNPSPRKSRLERIDDVGEKLSRKGINPAGVAVYGGGAAGAVLATPPAIMANRKRRAVDRTETAALRRERAAAKKSGTFGKKAPPTKLRARRRLNLDRIPGAQSAKLLRNSPEARKDFAEMTRYKAPEIVGATTVGGGLTYAGYREGQRVRKDDRRKQGAAGAAATGAGAIGGQAAFRSYGHSVKRKANEASRGPSELSRSQREKVFRAHRKKFGVPDKGKPAWKDQAQFYRTYPEKLPGADLKRKLGRMSGKRGAAMSVGATAAGGIASLGTVAAGRRIVQRDPVIKAVLYERHRRANPVRAGAAAAGLGLAAAGLGRSGLVGRALRQGTRAALVGGNADAVRALQAAAAAQGALRRGTAPTVAAARQIRQVDDLVRRVPASMRGDVAAAAGMLLVGQSTPVRQTSYRPASYPVAYRG